MSIRKELKVLLPENPEKVLLCLDFGVIQPMFSHFLDSDLGGLHSYFKVGFEFLIYNEHRTPYRLRSKASS